MLTLELFENKEPVLIQALRDFLPIAVKYLKLDHVPKIHLVKALHDTHVPTFGRFENESRRVSVVVDNRNPVDIIRTLAHELVHYAQGERGELASGSWHTGSPEENQAHEQAGIMMREFDSKFPQYLSAEPVMLPETWTKKYKKSINCSNPKGFSQKAHCAGRRARKAGRKTKSSSVSEAVEKPKLYTGEELDLRVHVLSKQLGMSPAEVRRQYVDPMLKDGRIKLVPSKVQEAEEGCPPATQDINLNLKNRQKAIDEYHYGPLNPNLPNEEYWQELADKWNTSDIESVKQNRCGNCGAFDMSKDMQACIAKGIGSEPGSNAMDSVEAGHLGYCKFLKFKCASKRTCDAWIEGGPITEGKRCNSKGAVPELKAALDKRKKELNKLSDKQVYAKIDKIMTRIANTYDLTGQELHDMWTDRYGEIPDTYIIENFADGRKPGRKGLAKRSGVNCKASVTQLRKVAKNSTGEKRRMAHWCANMKAGRNK